MSRSRQALISSLKIDGWRDRSTRHYSTLDYTTACSTAAHYTTPHCITLQYITVHYMTWHSITLHYTHDTALQQLQPHYADWTTLTTTAPLRYNYKYSCATPHYIQQFWVRWPLQPFQKTQLQPPFGLSVDSLCHPCIATTHLSFNVQSLKLPPSPCAVLVV